MEEVVGGGVDLDAVPPGRLQADSSRGEAVHQLFDLVDGQSVGRFLIVNIERGVHGHRRSGYSLGDEGVDAAPGSPMVELGVDGDSVLVDFVRQFGEVLDVLVVVYAEAPVALFQQGPLHGGRLGDDHPDAASCHRSVEGLGQGADPRLSVLEEVGLRRGLDDPVLQLHLADVERREEVLVL